MSTTVTTKKVRLSYCHVFTPQAGPDGGEPKYSTAVLVNKNDTETINRIKAAIDEAIQVGKTSKWGGKIPGNLKNPLRDGDSERPDDPNYAGMYFFNCSSKKKPGVVDKALNAILDPNEVYSGCYARVNVNFFPFEHSGNKGIAVGLNHIQKVADGEALGNAVSVEAAFAGDYDDDDEDWDA